MVHGANVALPLARDCIARFQGDAAQSPIALDYSLEMSQSAKGFSKALVEAPSPCREMRGAGMFFAKNLLISAFIEPRKRRLSLLYLRCCPGVGSRIKTSD